ncbi:MAG: DUF2911 domain-containing protein [Bacteroidia bacterium]
MNKLILVASISILILSACKETNQTTETNVISESETHPFLVNSTNKAWANAEELNKRVSPPKSVIAESENGIQMAIHYSSPFAKKRMIWDSLVPYNTVWRTGANEATIIEFSDKVKIDNIEVGAGSYSLFSIPNENGFTIILNAVVDQWGAYEYDENQDVVRFDVKAVDKPYSESMNFDLEGKANQVDVSFVWAKRGFEFTVRSN